MPRPTWTPAPTRSRPRGLSLSALRSCPCSATAWCAYRTRFLAPSWLLGASRNGGIARQEAR